MKSINAFNFEPESTNSNISNKELKKLLSNEKNKSLFCWHNWIIWRYGDISKLHRVCSKCYKKQISADVIIHGSTKWIEYNKK